MYFILRLLSGLSSILFLGLIFSLILISSLTILIKERKVEGWVCNADSSENVWLKNAWSFSYCIMNTNYAFSDLHLTTDL